MKQPSLADFRRLEQKIDQLHEKIDRLIAVQGITSEQTDAMRVKEEKNVRKRREQEHPPLLEKEAFYQQVLQGMQDQALRLGYGKRLQEQFNLLVAPTAARIREYQRTNDPKAFDGLRRLGQKAKKGK